jgi:hypothetical protein
MTIEQTLLDQSVSSGLRMRFEQRVRGIRLMRCTMRDDYSNFWVNDTQR